MLSYVLALSANDLPMKIFWTKANFLPQVIFPLVWFVFIAQYTGREEWMNRRSLLFLSIIPIITMVLVFTEKYHGLFWSNLQIIVEDEVSELRYSGSFGFLLHMNYTQILILSSEFLLAHMLIRSNNIYRLQTTLLLLVSFFLQLYSVQLYPNLLPETHRLTTVLFSIAFPLAAMSIFCFQMSEIVPVARGIVIDCMGDGVIVLDLENNIMDANSLVQELVSCSNSQLIGQPLKDVLPDILDQIQLSKNGNQANKEIIMNPGDMQRVYDVSTSSLTDWRRNVAGQIVILHDITDRKQAEEALLLSRLQMKNLFEASRLINSTVDINEIFKFISNSCQKLIGFDHLMIFLTSEDKTQMYCAYAVGDIGDEIKESVLKYGEGLTGRCIKTRESLLLGNIHENGREEKIMDITESFMPQIIVPLVIEGQSVGILYISRNQPNAYVQDDVDILKPLSEVVSSAIRNSDSYDKIKKFGEELEKKIRERSKRIEILLGARQKLQKETSWERGLNTIVESMKKLEFHRVGAFLVDHKREKLIFHLGRGNDLLEVGTSISLKNKEYFGVRCVLEKKTIHVEDSRSVEGKQLIESTSFVWVPIVVQDEAFAALAASTMEDKSVTDEDARDLEILAGMCAAFIDRTRIHIEPMTEKTLETEIKHRVNPMEGYIVLEKKPEKSFEIFVDLVTHGILGFVVSREYPEKLKEKYKLQKTPMLWLSESETKDAINPNDLPKLSFVIEDFTRKSTESVILLDGLEYLIIHTGFDTMLKYLHRLRDTVVLNNSRLIIPVNKEALSSKEFNMLEREFTIQSVTTEIGEYQRLQKSHPSK